MSSQLPPQQTSALGLQNDPTGAHAPPSAAPPPVPPPPLPPEPTPPLPPALESLPPAPALPSPPAFPPLPFLSSPSLSSPHALTTNTAAASDTPKWMSFRHMLRTVGRGARAVDLFFIGCSRTKTHIGIR